MFRTIIWPLALTLILACSPQTDEQRLTTPDPSSSSSPEEASQALNALVEAFFEEYLALNPRFASFVGDYRFNDRFVNDIGPVWREQMLDTHQRYLEALKKIDRDQLDEQDLLSYMIFERARRYSIESRRFPRYLLPINQFSSTPNRFALLGSGAGTHPFKTKNDYEDFLKRVEEAL